jgi:cobalt/nickel transport system ATP-binding protein
MTIHALEVKDLSFQYHDGKAALKALTFQVSEGQSVGLIGPNGAGKSTLLMHLNGILPEDPVKESSVSVFGIPVTAANMAKVRREVGLLFQEPEDQLFCPTVYEDVAFGPLQFGISGEGVAFLVEDALKKVGLVGYGKRSPHHLSSGEKQRVCLAGILACRPRILALDEPTRGLDPRGKRQLKSLLGSFAATKIIATHDLELVAELCTRVIVMDEGRIVADGESIRLLSDEDLMLAHGLEKPHILRHTHPH